MARGSWKISEYVKRMCREMHLSYKNCKQNRPHQFSLAVTIVSTWKTLVSNSLKNLLGQERQMVQLFLLFTGLNKTPPRLSDWNYQCFISKIEISSHHSKADCVWNVTLKFSGLYESERTLYSVENNVHKVQVHTVYKEIQIVRIISDDTKFMNFFDGKNP